MRDFLPRESERRRRVFETIRDVYQSYGFEPLETPALERLSTLLGKYGEEEKLIFKVMKRGAKLKRALEEDDLEDEDLADLALRFDLTVPLARVVAEYPDEFPRFIKRFQIGPVWRADRPQKGRFREFYQCDVDVVGSGSMTVEAEVTAALTDALDELGFDDVRIHTNHRKLLEAFMETAGVPDDKRKDALIAIDKVEKIGREGVRDEFEQRGLDEEAWESLSSLLEWATPETRPDVDDETLLERLTEEVGDVPAGREAIDDLRDLLDFADSLPSGDALFLDPSLARGLSYYTGPIFEIRSDDFEGSLGGGGRYDELIGMFTNRDLPACGFSLGVERILVLMEEREMFDEEARPADVLVTVWDDELVGESIQLANRLREAGVRTDLYPDTTDGFGSQFGYADERDIPLVAILAPDELEAGVVGLKDMVSGEQTDVERDDVVDHVLDALD
jgi:histidyl-tRNA synthetase